MPLEALGRCLEGNAVSWMDWSGPATEGISMLETARQLGRELPSRGLRWDWSSRASVIATASLALVDVLRHRDPSRASSLLSSSWDDATGMADSHLASFMHRARGFLASDAGRWAEAEEQLTESLQLARALGSRRSESRSLEELGRLAWARGELDAAAGFAEEATRLSRDAGHAINWLRCAAHLADIVLEHGDLGRARLLLVEAEATVASGHPDLAVQLVAPRQARLNRLAGDIELRHDTWPPRRHITEPTELRPNASSISWRPRMPRQPKPTARV